MARRAIADRPYNLRIEAALRCMRRQSLRQPQAAATSLYTREALCLFPRRGASVMRRDPKGKPTLQLLTGWVSKGTKSLRGILKGKALKRVVRAEP